MELMVFIALVVGLVLVAGSAAWIVSIVSDNVAERQNPTPGWDVDSGELNQWTYENNKEKLRCPPDQGGCGGTRCWDWRRNGRPCGDNPTEAPLNPAMLVGRHSKGGVQKAVAGWWPLPRTMAGRLNPQLWAKVAGHCQISLSRYPGEVLP